MSAKLNLNERSWAIQLIQEISDYVKNKSDCMIRRAGGEITIKSGKSIMFPDVLLFGDMDCSVILQGWEIKMPDVSIDNRDFIEDAWRKADNLSLNSTVIWNFRYAILYVKDEKSKKFNAVKIWDNSSFISEKRDDVSINKDRWITILHEVVGETNRFLSLGYFSPIKINKTFSDKIFETFILENKSAVSENLKKISIANATISNYINLWYDNASGEYVKDETDPFSAYAKVLLLDWVNKLLFAHILRPYFPVVEKITELSYKNVPQEGLDIFANITSKCDFFSVFRKMDLEENLPDITWQKIKEINALLCETRIGSVNHKERQSLLENSVNMSHRVITGQFATDSRLADFLVRISVNDANSYVIDPCCGTGTFARSVLNYKIERGLSTEQSYKTVFASDRQSFPLQIAALAMISKESINLPEIIFKKNVFNIEEGDIISIVNPVNGQVMNIKTPLFDVIVSNLPFVDFCRNNTKDVEDIKYKELIRNEVENKTSIRLNKRSDYYMYIIFHLWSLLKNNGIACVIVSNSWMSTAAGKIFFKALNCFFSVKGIIKSGSTRWFKNAKIISSAFLLKKESEIVEKKDTAICFYTLNTPLKNMSDRKILNKAVGTVLQNKEIDRSIIAREIYSQKEIDFFSNLNLSFNAFFYDVRWLYEVRTSLSQIKDIFTVFRGAKTGQDEIFITKNREIVDRQYVSDMLKNSKGCDSLCAIPDSFFVYSDKTYEELRSLGHCKTADYFGSFEGKLNNSVIQHGKLWYFLKEARKKASIITSINPGKRLFFSKFAEPACINQRLIGFVLKKTETDIDLCHALLNTTLGMFFLESAGFGRGDGVLDLNKDKIEQTFMLNPELISIENKLEILKAFDSLKKRKILDVEKELSMPDREELDIVVLKAYNILHLHEKIKNTLLAMIRTRIDASRTL